MGISRVLEAMASGGLEAYNEDIQKQRDYNMMADLEIKKANIQKLVDGNDNRYFSAADGNGNIQNLFELNDPQKWDVTELLDQDMTLIGSTLTEDYMNDLESIDPTLAYNVRKNVASRIQNSFVKRTVRTGVNKDQKDYPLDKIYGDWYHHPYFGTMFKQIYKDGVIPSELANNPDVMLTAKKNEDNKIVPKLEMVDSSTFGHMWNSQTNQMEPVNKGNLDIWSKEMNIIKGVGYSSEQYTNRYTKQGIQLYNTPVDATMQGAVREAFPYANPNAPITLGQLTNKIVQQNVPDQDLADSLYYTIDALNKTRNPREKITLDTVYDMFRLSAPARADEKDLVSFQDAPTGIEFMELYYPEIDVKKLAIRGDAAQNVITTTKLIIDNADTYQEKAGVFAPINDAVAYFTKLIAGFFGGEGSVPNQAVGLISGYKENYNIDTAEGVQATMNKYATEAEREDLTSAASLSARHRFYKYMLAYQLAVAIQGGTGGRTVSDQDVDNMLNAIGDSLFANGRVQLNVIQTIQDFAKDINRKNQYWLQVSRPEQAGGGPDAAHAAEAMDRYMFNLPTNTTVNDSNGTRTRVAGSRLRSHIDELELASAENFYDPAFASSERTGGSYTPDGDGMFSHMKDFKDSGIVLDEEQYYNLVDVYITRNAEMQSARNITSFNSYTAAVAKEQEQK